MNKVLIIDGNSIAYRAFYALPPLNNKSGLVTNSIFGFLNILFKGITDFAPTHLVCVFDFPAKCFRNDIYKEYKAQRKPMPDELAMQMPVLKDLLVKMGILVLEKKGFEADDVIGTLSKKLSGEKIIITGDRDCLQLITTETRVCLTKKGLSDVVMMGETEFMAEYGFAPVHIIDLKAIMGDASDNIPGVAGIGQKGATDLVGKYATIENIYKKLDDIPTRMKANLENGREMAEMSKKLATIHTELLLEIKEDDARLILPFSSQALLRLKELEFASLISKAQFFDGTTGKAPVPRPDAKYKTTLVTDAQTLNHRFKNAPFIAFCETTAGFHLADSSLEDVLVPVQKDLLDEKGLDMHRAVAVVQDVLQSKQPKLCFDYKADKKKLSRLSVSLNGAVEFDVHLAAWMLKAFDRSENPEAVLSAYGISDVSAANLVKIKDILSSEMKEMGTQKLYDEVEQPLITVLCQMENDGFKVNIKTLDEILASCEDMRYNTTQKMYTYAGYEFNINSTKQLAEVLYDKLKLPAPKNRSTSIEEIRYLRREAYHPVLDTITEHRSITKLISTYLVPFKKIAEQNDGFIHTTFNQTGTNTGRLSSSEPNLQNLPIRTDLGKRIRKMFDSRFSGGKIISADYSQIELRLLAHFSRDEKLTAAYEKGIDIHTITASEVFGIPLNEITPTQRREAKATNFGIIYGISAYGLSEQLEIPVKQAADYIDRYYARFPKIKAFLDGLVEKAIKNGGYAETLLGRKRKISELFSQNKQIFQFAERAAKNMPLQGTASDIIKVAMVRIASRLQKENRKSRLVLQIHDELVIDSPADEAEEIAKLLKEEMQAVVKLNVPLIADVEIKDTL